VKFAKDVNWLIGLADDNKDRLSFRTIDHYEKLQLERLRDYVLQDLPEDVASQRLTDLGMYLTEMDRRRGLNSHDVFPKLWEELEKK
jgi:hypothetical protein